MIVSGFVGAAVGQGAKPAEEEGRIKVVREQRNVTIKTDNYQSGPKFISVSDIFDNGTLCRVACFESVEGANGAERVWRKRSGRLVGGCERPEGLRERTGRELEELVESNWRVNDFERAGYFNKNKNAR